jgi:hypothetical protein
MREPAHRPEWTDFTPSDPGITLLQLFVYLVEALLGLALLTALWRYARRVRCTTRNC